MLTDDRREKAKEVLLTRCDEDELLLIRLGCDAQEGRCSWRGGLFCSFSPR